MALYTIDKTILLEEFGNLDYSPRSLSDNGFVMQAMKNKNKHQIDPNNNSVFGHSNGVGGNLNKVANNHNERMKHNVDQKLSDNYANNTIGPKEFPVARIDTNSIKPQNYNKNTETQYAHQDPFKPLDVNKHDIQHNTNDIAHPILGH